MKKEQNKIRSSLMSESSLVFLTMFLAIPCFAAENSQDIFRVTGHSLNFDAPKAEICLTFSSPIATDDREAMASKIRLEKDGKKVSISPRDLSLTSSDLCVQQLDHQHKYGLSINGMRDIDNHLLSNKASFSFVVPNRKPFLSFEADQSVQKLPRVEKNIAEKNSLPRVPQKLHAVNITSIQLDLYRITERKNIGEAWLQYEQVRLTPSESVYFVKNKGTHVWQSELVFGDTPNAEQSLDVILPSGSDLPAGLYFLSAKPKKSDSPSLISGMWFVVSDLKIAADKSDDGIQVFAANIAKMRAMPETSFQLFDKDAKLLSETKSDDKGAALLSAPSEKINSASVVVGTSEAGDVDIIDITKSPESVFSPLKQEAFLDLDKNIYEPGSIATISLLLRNEQGEMQKLSKATLKLLRPDQSFHSEYPVPEGKKGLMFATIPLPVTAETGEWKIMWQQPDGKILARKNLKISVGKIWPKLSITTDRSFAENDGIVSVFIKATDDQGKPLAGRSGRIIANEGKPDFPTWKKYKFGALQPDEENSSVTKKFTTTADGTARVQVQLHLSKDSSAARSVNLMAKLDDMAFSTSCPGCKEIVLPEAALNIPVRPQYAWVGVSPLSEEGSFVENKGAAFDIIAIDQNGKRRTTEDLYFNIYEEGRSFEWYPDEGHWEYSPLPSHRRIGGGRITLAAIGNNIIRWPVAAGHYVLEITDASGGILSQYGFDAVTYQSQSSFPQKDGLLNIVAPTSPLEVDKENKLKFSLAKPAMVSVAIGGKTVRHISNIYMPEGENSFVLPLETDKANWETRAQVFAQAIFADGSIATAKTVLPIRNPQHELAIEFSTPSSVISGSSFNLPVVVQKINKKQTTYVNVVATPDGNTEDLSPVSIASPAVQTDRDGKAQIHIELPEFSGNLKLTAYAWNDDQFAQRTSNITAKPALLISSTEAMPKNIVTGDAYNFNIRITNNAGADGSYTYALASDEGLDFKGSAKGAITLKKGQSKNIAFTLSSSKELLDELRIDVTGPNNLHSSRAWPIVIKNSKHIPTYSKDSALAPQKSATLSIKDFIKTKSAKSSPTFESTLMISATPLHDLPEQLRSLLTGEPVSTIEISAWLNAINSWRNELSSLGFASNAGLRRLIEARVQQLQQRQNDDGGFSASEDSKESDIASTAFAIEALQKDTPSSASIAKGIAARWLRHKLENNWFDESERSVRASAFLALSALDMGEKSLGEREYLSALRYFADTSKDKNLSPLAMAELSLALALNSEDALAKSWLQRSREELGKQPKPQTNDTSPNKWLLMQRFAENRLFEQSEIIAEFEKTIPESQISGTLTTAAYLNATNKLNQRAESWHMDINGTDKKIRGVLFLQMNDKTPSFTLLNKSQAPLFLLQTVPDKL